MRILIVEDDPLLMEGLSNNLKNSGFFVCQAGSGRFAKLMIKTENIDIVILDLGLPDIDGIEVLNFLKKDSPSIPVLILTARDALDDKIVGLELGADDYMVKPFEYKELDARLKVIERRISGITNSTLHVNGLELDIKNHVVVYNNKTLELSKKEFLVLKALAESHGRIVTKSVIESRIYDFDNEVASNTLEVHIHNLRKKTNKAFIKTIRGVGYTIPNR